MGLDHTVICGHRGEEEQTEAFEKGTSMVEYPDSRHNQYPSDAIDAGPYFSDINNLDWNDLVAFGRYAGFVLAVAEDLRVAGKVNCKLRWGGDWDGDGRTADHKFKDLPHFERVPV
jgi:peptidoglycan L-alanyl-D-glutamate endopeptidase CwlK